MTYLRFMAAIFALSAFIRERAGDPGNADDIFVVGLLICAVILGCTAEIIKTINNPD